MPEKKDVNAEKTSPAKKPAAVKTSETKKPAAAKKAPASEDKSDTVKLEQMVADNAALKAICENLSANNAVLKERLQAYEKTRYSADDIMSFIKLADDEYLGAVIKREKTLAKDCRAMEQRIEELERELSGYRKKTADIQRREAYGRMRILFNRLVEAAYKGGPKEIVNRLCDINLASEICWVLENEKIPFNFSQIKAIRDIAGEKLFDEVRCTLVKSSCWETHGTQQVSTAMYDVARKYYW